MYLDVGGITQLGPLGLRLRRARAGAAASSKLGLHGRVGEPIQPTTAGVEHRGWERRRDRGGGAETEEGAAHAPVPLRAPNSGCPGAWGSQYKQQPPVWNTGGGSGGASRRAVRKPKKAQRTRRCCCELQPRAARARGGADTNDNRQCGTPGAGAAARAGERCGNQRRCSDAPVPLRGSQYRRQPPLWNTGGGSGGASRGAVRKPKKAQRTRRCRCELQTRAARARGVTHTNDNRRCGTPGAGAAPRAGERCGNQRRRSARAGAAASSKLGLHGRVGEPIQTTTAGVEHRGRERRRDPGSGAETEEGAAHAPVPLRAPNSGCPGAWGSQYKQQPPVWNTGGGSGGASRRAVRKPKKAQRTRRCCCELQPRAARARGGADTNDNRQCGTPGAGAAARAGERCGNQRRCSDAPVPLRGSQYRRQPPLWNTGGGSGGASRGAVRKPKKAQRTRRCRCELQTRAARARGVTHTNDNRRCGTPGAGAAPRAGERCGNQRRRSARAGAAASSKLGLHGRVGEPIQTTTAGVEHRGRERRREPASGAETKEGAAHAPVPLRAPNSGCTGAWGSQYKRQPPLWNTGGGSCAASRGAVRKPKKVQRTRRCRCEPQTRAARAREVADTNGTRRWGAPGAGAAARSRERCLNQKGRSARASAAARSKLGLHGHVGYPIRAAPAGVEHRGRERRREPGSGAETKEGAAHAPVPLRAPNSGCTGAWGNPYKRQPPLWITGGGSGAASRGAVRKPRKAQRTRRCRYGSQTQAEPAGTVAEAPETSDRLQWGRRRVQERLRSADLKMSAATARVALRPWDSGHLVRQDVASERGLPRAVDTRCDLKRPPPAPCESCDSERRAPHDGGSTAPY
ncbi:hypothetical protein C8R47DRAFT_1084026 [Mycena vitilis]|nr:hypothetical protein C8R47DRAFT_1084026 [Mycena vitilis]